MLNSGSSSVKFALLEPGSGERIAAGTGEYPGRPGLPDLLLEDIMARSVLVVPASAGVPVARTCLGLARALDRRGVKVAFVKPVAQPRPDGGPDRSAALVAAVSALQPPEPLPTAELEQQLGEGGTDVVLEKVVAAWEPVYERSDVVVVEGLSAARPGCTRRR